MGCVAMAKPSLRGVCTRCWLVTGRWRGRSQNCTPYIASARGWLSGDWPSTGGVLNITAVAWTAGFQWRRSGDITRTQNVSKYMLVLALCLVKLAAVSHLGSVHSQSWKVKSDFAPHLEINCMVYSACARNFMHNRQLVCYISKQRIRRSTADKSKLCDMDTWL